LDKLLIFLEAVNLRKLKDSPERWRLRVGDWRVILHLDQEQEVLYVLRVSHRREAYR